MAEVETQIDNDLDMITYTVSGHITADDIIKIINHSYRETPRKLVLWDMSSITAFTLSPAEMSEISRLVAQIKSNRQEGKTALVTKESDFGFGVLYENLARMENLPYQYRSFNNVAAARSWLAL